MEDNKLQVKGFIVWGICSLFFLYEFFLRTVIGTFQHQIIQDLNITLFQFSLLSTTIFLLIYGCMQIPAGLIVDHIGLKKAMIISAVCCTVSSIGFSCSYSYPIALAYRALMGFGASFGFICLLISIHDWMPHKYTAIFIGVSQFIGTLGPMVAAGPLEKISISSDISWRNIFLFLSALGFVFLVFICFFVKNNRQKTGKHSILYKPEKLSTASTRLFSKIQPWWIALASASLYFSIEYLSENEGRSFLILKGVSSTKASYMITITWVGYAIGAPLLGFLSDTLERRKTILSFCGILGAVAIVSLLYLPNSSYLQLAFFMLGVSASGQSIGFATIAEQFKKQFVALGFGLVNGVITTMTAIIASLISLFLDYINTGESITLKNYLFVFNILIVVAFFALIIPIFFIKETYCKSAVQGNRIRIFKKKVVLE